MKKAVLVGALGAPLAGKTTTIALLFGELKKIGVSVDYLPEYARTRIREMKAMDTIGKLDENHQMFIRDKQEYYENLYLENNGEGSITLSDGSTANSFFYQGSEDFSTEVARYDLLFFCRNIETEVKDENRIHDKNFSNRVEAEMLTEINKLCPLLRNKVTVLEGSIDERLATALKALGLYLHKGNIFEISNQ